MKSILLLARTNNYYNILKTRYVQVIAIFDTIYFCLRIIISSDFINIHVTNACTLVKRDTIQTNSSVNHTTPLCLRNRHMLYLRAILAEPFKVEI